ncbi:MAG: phosphotransferase [Chloroflexi bacterium]|nr:phosphotransferase [Chloroflexota bacterium]
MSSTPENLTALTEELEQFLQAKLGDRVSITGDLKRLQGGFDTDTFAFDVVNAPNEIPSNLVLRLFRSARESGRVARESTIQNAGHAAGHPVAVVPVDSLNHFLIDRPFMLMELLPGSPLGTLLDDDQLVSRLPEIMARLQLGIHRLDSAGLRAKLTGSGVDPDQMTPTIMLAAITELAESTGASDLMEINNWLRVQWPEQPDSPTICHGDFHPNNVLFDDGKVTGIVDWGNVKFTHPEFDVAITHLTMSLGPMDMEPSQRMAIQPMIDHILEEYLRSYRNQQPISDELLGYYGALRSAHAYARVVAGKSGIDSRHVAHEGYAWGHPLLFSMISKVIETTTGIIPDPVSQR